MRFSKSLPNLKEPLSDLKLDNGSQIGVIGGGPSGSFFSFFVLDMAERMDIDLHVDIYEQKVFDRLGPKGCNHCGGIISESLVQILATEGINLPNTVVQRGIESYMFHTEVGSVKIDTPVQEKRIAAVHRGGGPLGVTAMDWSSFDGFLLELALNKGSHFVNERVESVSFGADRPLVTTRNGSANSYDLVVGAVGVNSASVKFFEELEFDYRSPGVTKTYICEFPLGHELIKKHFGDSMHVFLLNIPRLKFAALIPKGNNLTLCILGKNIDKDFVGSFLNKPEVKSCFPADLDISQHSPCQCYPKINVKSSSKPYTDRLVLIGDAAVTRLYKDGIGAAYYTAKAAASTALLYGISTEDFGKHYWPACKAINTDNQMGKILFGFTHLIEKSKFAKRGILRMVGEEQSKNNRLRMSTVLWDTFTGSAPYRTIFMRTLNPLFLLTLIWKTIVSILPFTSSQGGYDERNYLREAL